MMRVGNYAAGLLVAVVSAPGFAAEPDGPATIIARTELVRITVEDRLSAKFPATSARKVEQDALVQYYAVPDHGLLWIDETGLNERGKATIAEIRKADDYGLRGSDYALPNLDGFNAIDAKATERLADAEITISYAVLDYARGARGGRIDPQRLSKNLDPTLALPDPSEVIGSIATRADPATYLRSFQPQHPQFEALRHKLIELRGVANKSKKASANSATMNTFPE
jgi:murein L,D-transpeptidase YcbB/YkuD